MSELMDLYQEVILDHNKTPRNFGAMEEPSSSADGHNPLCGDRVTVHVAIDGDKVKDVRFEGSGCAISKASASLMTEALKGKSVAEAKELYEGFHMLLTGDPSVQGEAAASLGKLEVFSGVREFPVRVKCATLAWHTFQAAVSKQAVLVSTE